MAAEIIHPRANLAERRAETPRRRSQLLGLQSFFLRAHIGNYTLFITGVFHDRVESRSRRGAPDMEYFENMGATNFAIAAEHSMAREHSLTPIFRELGERFHDIRLALNDTAERHMHLDEPSTLILP